MSEQSGQYDPTQKQAGYALGKARLGIEAQYFKNDSAKSATEAGGAGQCDTAQCASESPYPHFRNVIDRLIDYHNRQSNNLHALLRALPQDMSRDSMQALYDLAKTQLGSIR